MKGLAVGEGCSRKTDRTYRTHRTYIKLACSATLNAERQTPNVTLTDQSNPAKTLTLIVDSPGQVAITSSGAQGTTFNLGGSLTLSSTTANGVYSGTLNVTVDYQ